jgi:hypothetical protein
VCDSARERAEDAESDLAEAQKESTNQTNRAEVAEAELAELKAQIDAAEAECAAGMEAWYQEILAEEAADLADDTSKQRNGIHRKAEDDAAQQVCENTWAPSSNGEGRKIPKKGSP